MAIIKRATNIKKRVQNGYTVFAKEINKVSDKITIESAQESMTLSGAKKINIKANNK